MPAYSFLPEIIICDKAHNDLYNRGTGGSEANQEKRAVSEMLHQKSNRYSDKKCTDNALCHNKCCFLESVEIADKTK